jgi:hypothetical protein
MKEVIGKNRCVFEFFGELAKHQIHLAKPRRILRGSEQNVTLSRHIRSSISARKLDPKERLKYEQVRFEMAFDDLLSSWVRVSVGPGTNPEAALEQFMNMIMREIDLDAVQTVITEAVDTALQSR